MTEKELLKMLEELLSITEHECRLNLNKEDWDRWNYISARTADIREGITEDNPV